MKINLKKTLALTLAIVMVLGLAVSGNVFATEDTNQVTHEGADLSNVAEVGNALQISKQIAGTGTENEFDITLTVKTLQDVRETIIEPDASVILVLDRSASMDKAIATGKNQPSYWDKAKAAAEKFIADFKADAERAQAITPSVKREISVVFFAEGAAGRDWQLGSSINTSLSVPSSVGGYKQGTNYEAAFKVANSLVGSAHTANVSVIFLTDGGPNHSANGTVNNLQTTGTSEMESDDGYVGGGGESATGVTAGERGAKLLKDAGIPIYSIYYDTGYTGKDKALQNLAAISGSNVSETDDAVALENLLKETKKYTTDNTLSPWSVTDPMGANVVFKSFAWTAEQVTANANDAFIGNVAEHQTGTNGIIWHILREAKPAVGTDGYYTYTLTYRVTLNNQAAGFNFAETAHPANGTTDLEYAVGSPIVVKHTDFDIPKVKAYAADLTFTKTGANPGAKLPGATFTLTDGSYVLTATSDADGVVNFANIPSGHTYILRETVAPTGYQTNTTTWTVAVAYGDLTINGAAPAGFTVANTPNPGTEEEDPVYPTLKIEKFVQLDGDTAWAASRTVTNAQTAQNFKFKITVKNTSTVPATNITLTDAIAGTALALTGDLDPLDFGLAAGASADFYATYTSTTNETKTNTATYSFDDGDSTNGTPDKGDASAGIVVTPPTEISGGGGGGSGGGYIPPSTPPSETPAPTPPPPSSPTPLPPDPIITPPPTPAPASPIFSPPPAPTLEPTPEPTPEPVFEIPEPPVPMAPGNYLEESEDGWIEFDEDGVPLGEWKWNEEEELWEFEEIIPLAEFEPEPDFEFEEEVPLAPTEPEAPPPPPKTGDSAVPFVFGGLLLTAALAAGAALKKRKED